MNRLTPLHFLMQHYAKAQAERAVCNVDSGVVNVPRPEDVACLDATLALTEYVHKLMLGFETLLANVKTMAQQLPINTGTCCCGAPMADHDPFDNHSPRDEGEYFITSAIEAAEKALANES
jgi:hypothetical protein